MKAWTYSPPDVWHAPAHVSAVCARHTERVWIDVGSRVMQVALPKRHGLREGDRIEITIRKLPKETQ